MDNFIFKGVSSESFNIIVNSLPPISKPTMRVEETEIDGVDGTIIEDLGYESYEKKIKITITKDNIDEIIGWLNGEGDLVLSNEPNKYYKAKVIEQIDFGRLIKYEPVEVAFRVQPFKYEYQEEIIETDGKNMFEYSKFTSLESTLTKTLNEDGSITITGIPSKDYEGITHSIDITEMLESGKTYTLSSTSASQFYAQINQTPKGEGKTSYFHTKNKNKISFKADTDLYTYVITAQVGTIAEWGNESKTITQQFQLEKGSVVTKFKQYGAEPSVTIKNDGNYEAKPVIEITGEGTIELIVNGNKLFSYTFPDGEDAVIIDSQKQDAYLGTDLKNRNMSGEFPIFEIGENTITWEGNISSIKISSKSRWL